MKPILKKEYQGVKICSFTAINEKLYWTVGPYIPSPYRKVAKYVDIMNDKCEIVAWLYYDNSENYISFNWSTSRSGNFDNIVYEMENKYLYPGDVFYGETENCNLLCQILSYAVRWALKHDAKLWSLNHNRSLNEVLNNVRIIKNGEKNWKNFRNALKEFCNGHI